MKRTLYRLADLANRIPIWLKDLSETEVKKTILCPEETRKRPVSKHLSGQLDRITGVAFGGDVRDAIGHFLGDERTIGPTVRYEVGKSIVNRGVIYSASRRKILSNLNKNNSLDGIDRAINIASIRSSFMGSFFFGHWLHDDCATAVIDDDGEKFFMPTPHWPDKKVYSNLLDFDIPTAGILVTEKLIYYDDKSQNTHKISRLHSIRDTITKKIITKSVPDIVFLSRGSGGEVRSLVNEAEIVEQLSNRDILCVSPDNINGFSIKQIFGCRLLISVEGSGIAHALFGVRAGGGILVLQPPDRFFNAHMDWAVPLGFKYGSVIGLPDRNGFRVPFDELLKAIDLFA